MSTSARKQVLILGGGFGGLHAALGLEKTLARDGDVQITRINRENCSLFTPMLHELAASDLDMTHIVNPVRKLLKQAQFFMATWSTSTFLQSRCRSSTALNGSSRTSIRLPGPRVGVDHEFLWPTRS